MYHFLSPIPLLGGWPFLSILLKTCKSVFQIRYGIFDIIKPTVLYLFEVATFAISEIDSQPDWVDKTSKSQFRIFAKYASNFPHPRATGKRGDTHRFSELRAISGHSPCPEWKLRFPRPPDKLSLPIIPTARSNSASPPINRIRTGVNLFPTQIGIIIACVEYLDS